MDQPRVPLDSALEDGVLHKAKVLLPVLWVRCVLDPQKDEPIVQLLPHVVPHQGLANPLVSVRPVHQQEMDETGLVVRGPADDKTSNFPFVRFPLSVDEKVSLIASILKCGNPQAAGIYQAVYLGMDRQTQQDLQVIHIELVATCQGINDMSVLRVTEVDGLQRHGEV